MGGMASRVWVKTFFLTLSFGWSACVSRISDFGVRVTTNYWPFGSSLSWFDHTALDTEVFPVSVDQDQLGLRGGEKNLTR